MIVADTGNGIAADDVPRLTERFYRAADSRGRTVEGSGIGLALVKNLVDLHGGQFEIESELGAGTTVTIRLPACEAPDAVAQPAFSVAKHDGNPYVTEALEWLEDTGGHARSAENRLERPLVVVADDNADMRRYLERLLGARWNVVSVGDGEAAREIVRAQRPELLITDVMMPTVDGFGLVQTIRSDPELAALPVIILSARAGGESAGEGFSVGADDYLIKPFSSQDLINRVAARLDAVARTRVGSERHRLVAERSTALG